MNGLIHIYCGDGKGKTTASMGLALRAAGADKKVLICQFLKSSESSELKSLQHIEGIGVLKGAETNKFVFNMSDIEKLKYSDKCKQQLRRAFDLANAEEYDMLVLDELCAAVSLGMLNEDELLIELKNKNDALEVVVTGRDPSPKLVEIADYVSEIKKVKHPYDKGVPARKGIEA